MRISDWSSDVCSSDLTGVGVYQTAADSGKFAIGVDSNQNYLHPGTMLTSMLKRVDVAAYKAFKDAHDGTWTSGIQNLGLAEDGVGWALDEHNKDLITEEMKAKVEQAAEDIVAGKLAVHDYTRSEEHTSELSSIMSSSYSLLFS